MTAFALGPILCVALFAMLLLSSLVIGIVALATRQPSETSTPSRWHWFPAALGLSLTLLAFFVAGGAFFVVQSVPTHSTEVRYHQSHDVRLVPSGLDGSGFIHQQTEAPPTAVKSRLVGVSLLGILGVALLSGFVVALAVRHRNPEEMSSTPLPGRDSRLPTMLLGGAALLAGLLMVGWTSGTRIEPNAPVVEPLQRLEPEVVTTDSLVRLPDSPADAVSAVDAAQDALPQSDRTTIDTTAPDWLATGIHTFDGEQLVVIASRQYATEQEARHDIETQVAELLAKDLKQFTQAPLRPRQSLVDGADVQRAIRDEYLQTAQVDFGSFFAPMYRLWCKVELSPAVREPFLVGWRAQLTEARTLTVVAGFGALLLAPLGVLFAGALNRATGGRGRSVINLSAVGSVLALWGVGAWVLNQYVVLWN